MKKTFFLLCALLLVLGTLLPIAGYRLTLAVFGPAQGASSAPLPGTAASETAPDSAAVPPSDQDSESFLLADQSAGAVVSVPRREYLIGAVAAEMPLSWPDEALKAQAVCARTYAVCQTKHRAQGFDICATTHCQVYQGTAASGANSDAAVDQTAGEFLYYSGRLVQEAVYYSSNGGASEDSLNVWGNDVGYLKGKIDPYEGKIASIIPRYNWSTTFTASELTTLLNNRGYGIGTVKNAYVSAYTDTGNVYSVTFTGTSGSKTVSREACRSLLNLRSQRFTISGGGSENDTGESVALSAASAVDSSGKSSALSGNVYVITSSGTSQLEQRTTTSGSGSFVISGSGYGHNVGMSQWGAYSMANLGYFTVLLHGCQHPLREEKQHEDKRF